MPTLDKRCPTPGCGVWFPSHLGARCPAHTKARRQAYEQMRRRDPLRRRYLELYHSKAWRTLRSAFLMDHPWCAAPGCHEPAVHVDHVRGVRQGGRFFDVANLQALCLRHHSSKSARAGERWPK